MFVDAFRHAARRRRPGKLLVERHAAAHRDSLAGHVGVVDQHHDRFGDLLLCVAKTLYEASRVKRFFAINISSFPTFKRARASAVLH
jgi:hypothetical protein